MGERHQRGFTLVETLAATIILTLVTVVVAMGVSVARRGYVQMQFESQANVLSSTITNALADPCRFANHKGTVSIQFNGNGIMNPSLTVRDGRLYLQGGSASYPLVNDGAYGHCRVSLDEAPDFSSETVRGRFTITSTDDEGLSHTYNFCFQSDQDIEKASRSSD